MNLFCVEHLLITISCFFLAALIAKYAENKTHRIWAYFNCATALWALFSLLAGLSKTSEEATIYWRISYAFGMFIDTLFYHFVCSYFKIERKFILISIYIESAVLFLLFLFFKPFVTVKFLFNSIYYITANPYLNVALSLWWIITLTAFYTFFTNIKADKTLNKASIVMFLAWVIGFAGGTATFFPSYGIMIYPMWHISVCLYAGIMTYGIFYHRLLPIDVVIKRSIIYSLLVATISLTYLLSVLISQQLFRQYFGYSSTIISSIIIAIAFIPLKNKIQDFVDRFFLKATPIEIVQQNEQLRQEVAHTEKFKAMAALSSGIAHEIKNPLTVLQVFCECLPDKKDDPEFIKKYQALVPKEINRINVLVQDLLAFAKPSPPQLESIDPQKIIKEVINLTSLYNKNIQIQTKFDPKSIKILVDPQQLKQALLNITLNAIEAMPDGGTLTITTSNNKNLSFPNKNQMSSPNALVGDPEHYIIEISDTGHGITPEDLKHIFDPFFTKKLNGTGLGLSITKDIIEKNGGKITTQSELGKGTNFTIDFYQETYAS